MQKWIKKFLLAGFIPLIFLALFLNLPKATLAATGGRIGGSNFRQPSVSIPRTRTYGGGYNRGYGGYGYRGGGIGFPFILPFFGFGGGGLLGLLILMSIIGLITNSLKNTVNQDSTNNIYKVNSTSSEKVMLIQVQIGLLAAAKELQKELREIAKTSETKTPSDLQKILQATTLSLLRQPDLWVYANLETGSVPLISAESTFNRISITERSKLKAETTSNYSGQIKKPIKDNLFSGDASSTNEYIAATLIVASKQNLNFNLDMNSQQMIENLRILGSISSSDLIALEVIWQPDGKGDNLSAEELLTSYPNLKHL